MTKSRRTIAAVITAATIAGNTITASAASFADVQESHWSYSAVSWAADSRVISGTSQTTFAPDAVCTRAQFVTMMWRAAGSPMPRRWSIFSDVQSNHWAYTAITWALESHIIAGTDSQHFNPDGILCRADAVLMLHRQAGEPQTYTFKKSYFEDMYMATYAKTAVDWAVSSGITNGTKSYLFSPLKSVTRAEAVTFLYRAANVR